MSDLVRLIARVPPELRDAVKVEAARSRRSVQSIVVEALEAWLARRPASLRALADHLLDPEEASDARD